MACHEIAALRLGLMNILGREDAAERQHEVAELGPALDEAGPIQSLSKSQNLAQLKVRYDASVGGLEERVARTSKDDPQMPYYRTLLVLTKRVELELEHHLQHLTNLYADLDEIHDFMHEVYPAE